MDSPQVQFVERAGDTVIEGLGRTNPWSMEWFCPRSDCLPCQGRIILAAEAEEEAMVMLDAGSKFSKKTKPEERKSLPSCTGEGRNYIIEGLTCRKEGIQKVYLGETSRS